MTKKDLRIQDLRAENEKLKEELEQLKQPKAAVDTDMDKLTTEMMEYICDNLCKHPIRVGQTQDELDDICAECKMGKFVCDILNKYNRNNDLVNVLAKKLLSTEFGRCYMCTNSMKNITLDGINNGCDGMCNATDSATVEDFIRKILGEIEAQSALEKMKGDKSKQYVLVSQGIEIYRTTDKDEAERMMNESNAKHYEYLQRCADEGERPADNMIYMHVEE